MSGKKVRKVPKRLQNEINKERAELVRVALDMGVTTRKALSEAAGCKMFELNNLFAIDRKLYREYQIRRKNLAEIAADNIEDIVNDPNHPNNYAASKWIVDKFKSDLDKSMESQDSDEISVEIGKGLKKQTPVVISFGKKSKEEEEK